MSYGTVFLSLWIRVYLLNWVLDENRSIESKRIIEIMMQKTRVERDNFT